MLRSFVRVSVVFILFCLLAGPVFAAEGRIPVFAPGTLLGADGKYIVTRSTFTAAKGRGQLCASASRAAATVASISASPCSVDRNPASNCEGAR